MATIDRPNSDASLLLHSVSWQTYLSLRDSDENGHLRMTYDSGSLEIMSPSKRHERLGYLLGRLIDVWTEEMNLAVHACRCTTFRREDMRRGLEPDNCYYTRNAARVRDRDEIDLSIDPPPDLAVEIDVTASSIDRLKLYAALGVPEVWRYTDGRIHVLRLTRRGYRRQNESLTSPGFPLAEAERLLAARGADDDNSLVRPFRDLARRLRQQGTF